MILFHGSDQIVERPAASYGRNKVDFGQGFYLTSLHEQASKWARIIAFKNGVGKAFVCEYEFDENELPSLGYRYKKFLSYDMEWRYVEKKDSDYRSEDYISPHRKPA